jgi:hypothetical protein
MNRDFRDLFLALNVFEVRYLIVGAYAVTFHSRPRFTEDLDVWADNDPTNAQRAWRALASFGAPLSDLKPSDLSNPELVYQVGVPPNRIDILTSLDGVNFSEAWSRRAVGKYGDCPVAYLSRQDLITNKRIVGRPQDLLDVEALES